MQKKTPDYDNVFMARQFASWDIGHATIPMPRFSIIYVKRTDRTPKTTTITFTFPDGQTVDYKSDNAILEDFTKEKVVEKDIARYEKEIASEGNIEKAIEELNYLRDELVCLYQEGELSDDELIDLKGFVNTIITHMTNGNKNEERLVNIMGGTVIETESDKIKIRTIIEMGQEVGLDDSEF